MVTFQRCIFSFKFFKLRFSAEISLLVLSFVGTFLLCTHCFTVFICSTFLPLLLLHVCRFENKLGVGNAPNTFLRLGKCKAQALWHFNGCVEIPKKFNHVFFKLVSFGNL